LKPILKSDLPSDSTYTLGDLESWPTSGHSLAVLGHPVKHSLSPPMHNAALAEMAEKDPQFSDWTYFKFDISPENLEVALTKFHEKGFHGLNLTVPHKILAVNWVKCGETEVEITGACNTLLRNSHGFTGYNTDLYGMTTAVESEFNTKLKNHNVILLGAGGAARAAAVACAQAGVLNITLANRTISKLETILRTLDKLDQKPEVKTWSLNEPFSGFLENQLIINATSLGLHPDDPAPVDVSNLPKSTLVFDMIYNPERTALLKQAESLGMRVANGLSMLAYQGERSLKIWTQQHPSAQTMFNAAFAALNRN
jgi:shikimate dehydrogenase